MDFNDPTYFLDINGLSYHPDERPGPEEYNERNYGVGITRETLRDKIARTITAGGFKNSYGDPTLYAGAGISRQFGNDFYTQLGAMGGVMTGYDQAIAPMGAGKLTLGKKGLGRVNFLYAPPVGDNDAFYMMNLGIPFK